MKKFKLPFGQVYKTIEEVKQEIKQRNHAMPKDSEWAKDEVVSGIGIYKPKEGILYYWLIGVSDELPGR